VPQRGWQAALQGTAEAPGQRQMVKRLEQALWPVRGQRRRKLPLQRVPRPGGLPRWGLLLRLGVLPPPEPAQRQVVAQRPRAELRPEYG
jgi:hypothetical protein